MVLADQRGLLLLSSCPLLPGQILAGAPLELRNLVLEVVLQVLPAHVELGRATCLQVAALVGQLGARASRLGLRAFLGRVRRQDLL